MVNGEEEPVYKDVVIIGNGPSAISLSYLLSGSWPNYNGGVLADSFLQQRLQEHPGISLVEQDLQWLSNGLEGRSLNPVSLLFDALTHPNADLGHSLPSCLTWNHSPNRAVDHVVLGLNGPGGTWHDLRGSHLTLSLSRWMELPDLAFDQWMQSRRSKRIIQRASFADVAHYYEEYVALKGLSRYFLSGARVTSVRRVDVDEESGERSQERSLWLVRGMHFGEGGSQDERRFRFITPHVVLATGASDMPRKLNVECEGASFVLHNPIDIEHRLHNLADTRRPVLVVGAGLSAADMVLLARARGIPVVHCFRRSADDRSLVFHELPPSAYPEYVAVHDMIRRIGDAMYTPLPRHQVIRFDALPEPSVTLLDLATGQQRQIRIALAAVLVGSGPRLSYLANEGKHLAVRPGHPVDSKHNPIDVDPFTCECRRERGLYALGPLIGDNFVRFLRGGALAITSSLWRNKLAIVPADSGGFR